MTATLTAIFFEKDTEETLLKISAAQGPEELEKSETIIAILTDLGDSTADLTGQPDGNYALVLEADLAICKVVYPYLINRDNQTAVELPEISLEKVAQSSLFYRDQYTEADDKFQASAQDDEAEEQYENDCRAISSMRAESFKEIMAPYVTNSPYFFHEMVLALDLLAMAYAEAILAVTPDPALNVSTASKRTLQ